MKSMNFTNTRLHGTIINEGCQIFRHFQNILGV